MNLSVRQERALEELKRMPVPPAPAILKASLVQAPLWVRWAPAGAVLLAAALIGLVFVRLPLTESGSHVVISEGLQTIHLADGNTTLILQSPADLQVRRLDRRLLSGRLEADFLLRKGDLFLEADPHLPKQILIQTPLLQARITGTQLLIGHRPEEGSRLVVLRGRVQVKPIGGAWSKLPAGEELTVRSDGRVLRQPIQSAFDPTVLSVPGILVPDTQRSSHGSEPVSPDDSGMLRRTIWHEQE